MAIATDPTELAYLSWLSDEEKAVQKTIVLARDYYAGEQHTELTERQKQFLGFKDSGRFAVNYCKMVINAVAERMIVAGFESVDKAFAKWTWDLWTDNRMGAAQMDVHQNAVRDGEHFVFVDWDEERGVRLVPHPRYTDAQSGGDGYGCKAFFEKDDPANPMERATKRWTERIKDERGRDRTRQRMNVYYPERIEKYVMGGTTEAFWVPFQMEGEPWPMPWMAGNEPIGVPIIPFMNPDRITELWDAIPIQDAINKAAIDLVAAADNAGFPIRLTAGFYLTTDGKAPESDGSNYVELTPGTFLFVPEGKTIEELDIPDLRPLLEDLDNWVMRLGQVTDTPLSRFQLTRQVKSEKTLKQEEAPLLAKIRERQVRFGNSWEDCFKVAARLESAFGAERPSVDADTLWEPAETRDEKAHIETIGLKVEKLRIPVEQAWREAGYNQEQIDAMLDSDEYRARMTLMEMGFQGSREPDDEEDQES